MLIKKLVASVAGSILCFAGPLIASAQDDTLRMNMQETEAMFLQKNLQLIAAHYNVLSDSALIQQARLWDNPTFTLDQNVYVNGRFFEHGRDEAGNPTGQFYMQAQQLIQLGGKRSKAVRVATTNKDISQLQFTDLMHVLRQTVHKDFHTILQLQRYASLYALELEQINKLTSGMEAQFKAGNIARKDLLRVQAIQVGLDQQRADNARALEDAENELRTILGLTGNEFVQPVEERLSAVPKLPTESIEDLVGLAKQHNSTYLIAAKQVQYQQETLKYQKSLAVPDLTVGPNYDRASNFAPNYLGLTLGIPIPLWNRNQGNIKAAHYNVQQEASKLQVADVTLQNDVRSAYRKLAIAVSIASPKTTEFFNNYRELFTHVIESYQARQISLVEFIDYINGYEDIREKQLQQQLNIQLAKEELNYVVGVDVAE